jgi:MFS family permease
LGRRFALPLAGASIILTAATGGLGLMIQLFLKAQNAPIPLITLAASLGSAGALLGSVLWGRISDRASRRLLLLVTLVGVSLAIGILVSLPPASVVVGSSFLRSLMDAGFGAVSLGMVSAASAVARRGKNLSYVSSARSLGWALGALGSGVLLEHLGFRGGFALMATMPMIALLVLLFLPHDRAPVPQRAETPWRTLRSAGLADLYVGTILRQMGINGAFSLLYVYMDTLTIAPSLMGILSACNTATQVLMLIVFGRLVDRIGRRRVFMFGFGLSAIAITIFGLAHGPIGMAVGYTMVGVSFSSLYIGSTAHIGDRVPHARQGTMLGLYETMRGLGGVVGPLVAGALASWLGYRGMFFGMATIGTLGFSALLVGRLIRRPA